jgi:glycosyltransferase involved in cell wall biosynthesis
VNDQRPLRVAVDGTSLLGRRTGVGHMIGGMVDALASRRDVDLVTFAVTWRGRKDLARLVPPGTGAATARVPARLARSLWTRADVPKVEHWTGPVDIVHAPNFVAPPARAPVVVTIHDLTFVRYPEMCTADALRYPRLIRRALARGATVHAVSEFVASEVREEFGLPPDRVVSVYAGLRATVGGDAAAGRLRAGASQYVLALGTIEPRKNLPTLVRAFDAIAADHHDVQLVVAGPDGWDTDAFASACASARHRGRIRRLGYVSEADRRDLVAGATVFAYPSLYEGFGHPPLEAMAAGVPVVASRAGALPEVLGDAALLIDPHDQDALADGLATALDDEALRTTLVERGRGRAQSFSWTRAADELVGLYERLHAAPVAP